MEVVDADNNVPHSEDSTTVDKQNGTTTSKTNVSIYQTSTVHTNSVEELAFPTTQSIDSPSSLVYLSDGMESTDSHKVTGLKIAISDSANNGEIVIDDEAQSPVLKDQLQKLREFDDFVDSLDIKNGSRKANGMAAEQRNGGSIQIGATISNGKDMQSNTLDDEKGSVGSKEGTLSFETSSDSPASIIIDSGGLGGLMGLVSISPADSPIKRAPTSQTSNIAKTAVTNERTMESNSNTSGSVATSAKKSNNMSGFGSSFSPPSSRPIPIENTVLSLFDPHAPIKSPPSSTKQSWVLFDDDDTEDRMSTSSRGTSMSSSSVKYQGMAGMPIPQSQFSPSQARSGVSSPAGSGFVKDWVKFGAHSPRFTPNSPLVPQNTGGSIHSSLYSCEFLQDDKSDRQSDITASASALSSHAGSFSGSHDNISHDYMPLESPKNIPTPIPEGWIKFDETAATSPTKAKIYFVGSAKPGHTRSQSAGGPFANDVFDDANRRRASSTAMTSQLQSQPEELVPSTDGLQSKVPAEPASPPPPVHQPQVIKQNNIFQQQAFVQQKQQTPEGTHGTKFKQHVALPDDATAQVQVKNATNLQQIQSQKLLQQQLLQKQQILLQQQQQQQLQKQKLAAVGRQLQQIQEQQLIQTTPVESQSASSLPGSAASQSPVVGAGNPFRDDFLQKQQQSALSHPATKASSINDINITPRSATSSPFNPFRLSKDSTNGESRTVTASATWETFGDPKKNRQVASSPGNPFKQMMVTANVHPQNMPDPGVYETIQEPRYIVMPETKTVVTSDSKPPQLPAGHPLSSPAKSVPQTPTLIQLAEKMSETPQVLNNQTSAALNTNSGSVPFHTQVDNLADSEVKSSGQNLQTSTPQQASTQQQPEEGSISTFVDEYPRDEVDPTEGWSLMLRCPDKKKLTGSRYWKPVHVRLIDGNVIQLFDDRTRKEPFRELPLQSNYEFGDRRLQAYDTRGKIHTIKIFYVSYKEKKRFSSLETQEKILHSEPLIKLGSTFYDVFKTFIYCVNEALMKLTAFRDRGRHYEQDMMTVTVSDDYRGYVDYSGEVLKQSITTDLTVLAFLSGMPACAIGLNDSQRRGAEVVSRRDIIPNKTDEWIKMEKLVLHKCANKNVFTESRYIEFTPLDGCRFKLMQFKSRPKTKELPMYVKVKVSGENSHIDMRADLYIPARTGKQNVNHHICENIMVRVPLPEAWIRYFRKEKRIKGFSSIKSVTKKADQIKSGSSKSKLIEVSVGSAKYEHAYRAVVWRIDRLPQKSTNLAVTQIMRVQLPLRSMNELPVTFFRNTEVEFTMPHTTASKTTVRSMAVATDTSPDKRVRYTAKYEYQVEVEKSFDLPPDDKASECVMQ